MINNGNAIYCCRICGLRQETPPWGYEGDVSTFDFCPCCGVQFGYQDCRIEAIRKYREEWIEGGMVWEDPSKKPTEWSFELQRVNIPMQFM